VSLVDVGVHRLRDLSEPLRVFQVVGDGLPSGFPPVLSMDAFPGNLPLQVSPFIGREVELGRVAKALGEARVVTLTGVGGWAKPGWPCGPRLRRCLVTGRGPGWWSWLRFVIRRRCRRRWRRCSNVGAPRPRFDRDFRHQTSELLHDALDEGRLRQLRAEGEAMDSDQAAAYALEAIRRARQSTAP
jgi:hypothetical protein